MPRVPRRLSSPSKSSVGRSAVSLPKPGKSISIELKDYRLRSLRPKNIDDEFVASLSHEQILQGLHVSWTSVNIEDIRRFVGAADNRRRYMVGIFNKKKDRLIGFYQVDVLLKHRKATITAAVSDTEFWGLGVLRTTAGHLIEHLFKDRNIQKVALHVVESNRRMLYSLMGTPFEYEGCLKKELVAEDGRRLDVHLLAWIKD